MSARVGTARGEDLAAVLALLEENDLPREGLDGHIATALVAREGRRVVGSAALALAHERGARRAYLLTETADGFFPRFGFRAVSRSEVPAGVRGSVEFVSACPESARTMAADLAGRTR